jgi:hypothetical protein
MVFAYQNLASKRVLEYEIVQNGTPSPIILTANALV